MQWLIYLFAVFAGVLNAIQPGCNAALNKALGLPFVAAITISAVTFSALLVAGLLVGGFHWPMAGRVAQVPWWAWIGGAMGAVYIMSMLLIAERLGAALFLGLTVTSAIITSLLLDHFGLVGFRQHPAGALRILGALLMIGGLGLIARF
ncbi:MAG TPA: DMT family transporter [Stellaceae bacterium]